MINFKISGMSDLITVLKPAGKPIPLNIGEIVKGDVIDILPSGGVTLKIKDSFITARTDIPLQKNTGVMLKVIGTPSSPNELQLQFIGVAEKEDAAPAELKGAALNRLLQDFSSGALRTSLTLEKIEGLLKALPLDVNAIPKEIRLQIQNLLQDSLKSTGQNIQLRLEALFGNLPSALKNQPGMQGLKVDMTVSVDNLVSDGLKGLLMETGVALESKLKAIVELMQKASGELESGPVSLSKKAVDIKQLMQAAGHGSIENDLKANLLRLKEALVDQAAIALQKDAAVLRNATTAVDGILKDIETFQLLSRTTESFYTFLPVSWQELKDGEIAFKQNKGEGAVSSFSCRLNLDLQDQGNLIIMVLQHNNDFFVSFRPESEGFKSLLTSNIEHLGEQFKGNGLSLKAVRVLDKDDTSLDQLERLEPFRQIVSIKA